MRKLIYTILLLFIATPLFGQSTVIVAKKKAACTTEAQTCTSTANVFDATVGKTAAWKGSTFVADFTGTICSIKLSMKKVESPTFNINVYIYTDVSDAPNELVGTGSNAVAASTLGAGYGWIEFTGMSAAVTATNEYWIVVKTSATDETNHVAFNTDINCKDTYGIKYSSDGSSWTNSSTTRGALFYAYQ
jgi:hypothetical protein